MMMMNNKKETDKQNFDLFQVDYTNKKIIPIPGVRIESDSRYFLKLHPDFLLSGVLNADGTVTTVANTTTETELNSYTIPLNTLSRNDSQNEKAGNVLRVYASGVYSTANASDVVQLRLKFGGTTIHTLDTSVAGSVSNASWDISWIMIFESIGSSGTMESYAKYQINNVEENQGSTSTTSIDTTQNNDISITAEWDNADSGNTFSNRQFMVELLN